MNCRICHRVSAAGDHLDCIQGRALELEEDTAGLPEKLNLKDCEELGPEIRAVLGYLARS